MFIGFSLSILLTVNFSPNAPEFQFYMASFLFIFFLGMKDDILVLSATKKLLGQILVAALLIFKANLVIDNMQGMFGIYSLNPLCSYALTTLSIVAIINAFNLIDGIDGLAGGLGLISSTTFGIFFLINHDIPYASLAFTFAGSLAAFLYYNLFPAKIFMGDTGSLLVGLVNSILVIKFIQVGHSYSYYPISAAPAVGFGILLLPLMDTLRVFSIRLMQGRSPFSADRNHIHHLFLRSGFTHRNITGICILSTVLVSITAFALQKIGNTLLLASMMFFFFCLIYLVISTKRKPKLTVVKGDINGVERTDVGDGILTFLDKKTVLVKKGKHYLAPATKPKKKK
jgi:UDP-N-acetylmuramyl pentapeptide phosphotransferase/UDP-N-acetylglucosamine-1-phosphate transferase